MQKQSNLSACIDLLNRCSSSSDYLSTLQSFLPLKSTLLSHAIFSNEKHVRIGIRKTENYELLLLCWNQGQGTAYHDHDDSECFMSVLDGTLNETVASNQGAINSHKLVVEQTSNIAKTDIHSIKNDTDQTAVSLHLYVPPMQHPRLFESGSLEAPQQRVDVHTDYKIEL